MYLHKDKQLLEDVINATSEKYSIETEIIEKDYYVTMILKLLSNKNDKVVFKGGTSLSKCFQIINRFSEDIDITFSEHIGESKRKKLKYSIMKSISDELGMPIGNWNEIESDKDLIQYLFQYEPIAGQYNEAMIPDIKVETALGSYAFPVENAEVTSYVYRYLLEEAENDLITEYELMPFFMKVQTLERTYIDKIFALCDYFMQEKSKRYSRHLYDIYKMQDRIMFDENFKKLVKEVREHRRKMGEERCPSAQLDVSIPEKIKEICETDFYKADYDTITEYFIHDTVLYEETITNFCLIAKNGIF